MNVRTSVPLECWPCLIQIHFVTRQVKDQVTEVIQCIQQARGQGGKAENRARTVPLSGKQGGRCQRRRERERRGRGQIVREERAIGNWQWKFLSLTRPTASHMSHVCVMRTHRKTWTYTRMNACTHTHARTHTHTITTCATVFCTPKLPIQQRPSLQTHCYKHTPSRQ